MKAIETNTEFWQDLVMFSQRESNWLLSRYSLWVTNESFLLAGKNDTTLLGFDPWLSETPFQKYMYSSTRQQAEFAVV